MNNYNLIKTKHASCNAVDSCAIKKSTWRPCVYFVSGQSNRSILTSDVFRFLCKLGFFASMVIFKFPAILTPLIVRICAMNLPFLLYFHIIALLIFSPKQKWWFSFVSSTDYDCFAGYTIINDIKEPVIRVLYTNTYTYTTLRIFPREIKCPTRECVYLRDKISKLEWVSFDKTRNGFSISRWCKEHVFL